MESIKGWDFESEGEKVTMLDDFMKEETGVWPAPVEAEPGDMQTDAPERESNKEVDEAQTVEDESKGDETYTDPKVPPMVEQLIGTIAKAFKPQPVVTPEDERAFITDTDVQHQVQAFLRYIATVAIKVQPVPNNTFKTWTQVVNADEARPIAGYQPNRKRLVIRTRGADTEDVFLADEQGNASSTNGFTLEGGLTGADKIEMESVREVWAIASEGDTVTLELMGEYYG